MLRVEIERRPLVAFVLGLVLGLTLVRHPINLALVLPAAWVLHQLGPRAIFVSGLALGALLAPGPPPPLLDAPTFVEGDFSVLSMPTIDPRGQFCEVGLGEARFGFVYDGPRHLCSGERIHIAGVARPPSETIRSLYSARGWIGSLQADPESVALVEEAPWIQCMGLAWRDRFLAFAHGNLSPPAAASASAMCCNVSGYLSDDTVDQLKRTNTYHVVVASGLQVVVIALAVLWILQWLPIPRGAQICLAAAILTLYAVGTGLHPPVVRAVLMTLIAWSAYLIRREADWLTALAASSLIYLVWRPATVFEMGFQFSAVAVFFLSIFHNHISWRPGIESWAYRGLSRGLRTSIIATFVMSPFLAYQFGYISLVSIPANLMILLATPPLVILAMLAFPLALAWPALGGIVARPIEPLSSYISAVLNAFGGDRAILPIPEFSAYWLALFYGVLILLWRPYVRSATH